MLNGWGRTRPLLLGPLLVVGAMLTPGVAGAQTLPPQQRLCDPEYQDCRADVLTYIAQETQEIDMAFWMMTDARYSNALVAAWQRGVKIRLLMDPRCVQQHQACGPQNDQLQNAGVPMRQRITSGILHWKMALFASQGQVEFAGANYAPYELGPDTPYQNYTDEIVMFTNDPSLVHSFMTKFDDMWTSPTEYSDYANITQPLTRSYPTYPEDPQLNFPNDESYRTRSINAYNAETAGIDVAMFRITDEQQANAMIDAVNRGVPVRLYTDQSEYRDSTRLWHAYNVDKLYHAGVTVRIDAHQGINHEKLVLLRGQGMTIFGSSNWTSPSTDTQREHNMFTTQAWIYDWASAQFTRKWTNGSGYAESQPFTPLPPDAPMYNAPANGASGVSASSPPYLTWYAGPWGQLYDIYFGTSPTPPLFAPNQKLGPSQYSTDYRSFTLPTLQPGTTYYWRVVSKTMAYQTADGPVWSFTTAANGSANTPPSVSITSPATGATFTTPTTLTITASAADSDGTVAKVDFYQGSTLLGTATSAPYSVTWSSIAPDTYGLTAIATDNLGATTRSGVVMITVSAPNSPPTVSITSPSSGATFTAPASVLIAAAASDSDGAVVEVDFYNGSTLLGTARTAPYTLTWTSVQAGTYRLTAVATDNLGAFTTSAPVSITVDRVPAPTITAQPADVAATAGDAASFAAAAASASATTQQWQVSTDRGVTFTDIAGATNGTYTFTTTVAQSANQYRAVFTNAGGSVASRAATLTVTPPPCSDTISPTAARLDSGGGTLSVAVTAASTCSWTAASNDSWIVVSSGSSGTGNGTVQFVAAANPSAATRSGTLTIAGQTLTVTQTGAPAMTVDRSSINFAAVSGGGALTAATSRQQMELLQMGAGTVTWTARADQPWVTVSPATGTGSATLTVGVQFSNALPPSGTVLATIRLTYAGAASAGTTIRVRLTIIPAGTSTAPTGSFDTPGDGERGVTGSVAVTGWALDDVEVTRVRILRDAVSPEPAGQLVFVGNATFIDGARSDVAALMPDAPLNTRAGWGYLLLTEFLPNGGNGAYTLYAFADDAEGLTTLLGKKTIVCANASSTAPFGAIDTPEQGATVSGTIANFGWVLAPGAGRADVPGGGTVTVLVDGVPVGAPSGWTARSDLQAVFPKAQFSGIDTALAVFALDTTTLPNGVHSIAWLVTDREGETSGVGSRFFTVANGVGLETDEYGQAIPQWRREQAAKQKSK